MKNPNINNAQLTSSKRELEGYKVVGRVHVKETGCTAQTGPYVKRKATAANTRIWHVLIRYTFRNVWGQLTFVVDNGYRVLFEGP